jgi:hypothetical protein
MNHDLGSEEFLTGLRQLVSLLNLADARLSKVMSRLAMARIPVGKSSFDPTASVTLAKLLPVLLMDLKPLQTKLDSLQSSELYKALIQTSDISEVSGDETQKKSDSSVLVLPG